MYLQRTQIVSLIQRRVGIAGAVVCAALVLVNIFGGYQKGFRGLAIVSDPSVFVVALFGGVAYVTTVRDRAFLRAVQVVIFLSPTHTPRR